MQHFLGPLSGTRTPRRELAVTRWITPPIEFVFSPYTIHFIHRRWKHILIQRQYKTLLLFLFFAWFSIICSSVCLSAFLCLFARVFIQQLFVCLYVFLYVCLPVINKINKSCLPSCLYVCSCLIGCLGIWLSMYSWSLWDFIFLHLQM